MMINYHHLSTEGNDRTNISMHHQLISLEGLSYSS